MLRTVVVVALVVRIVVGVVACVGVHRPCGGTGGGR